MGLNISDDYKNCFFFIVFEFSLLKVEMIILLLKCYRKNSRYYFADTYTFSTVLI